ncbi:MAG: O-antigen ligase family protein [Solirubrobacterales bacterium]
MNPTSMRRRIALLTQARSLDPAALAIWLLAFGLIVYLGLKGGGYDPLVHDRVGIAGWWLALAAVAVGALPRRRPGVTPLVALGLLGAFVAWTALSLSWTESTARTSADLARVATYLGIFALAVFAAVSREASRLVSAVAAGIVVLSIFALLSRLHPSWFPEATQTATFIDDSRERLSYPLNYWNGLAALIAIGAPLVLQVATGARSILARALAAAALPALTLTAFFTLSRGGIAAAILALAIYLALVPDRLPRVLSLGIAAAGGAILIVAAAGRDALQEGLRGPLGLQQGDEMVPIAIGVCLVVGLLQAGLSYVLEDGRRPGWTRVSQRQARVGSALGGIAILAAAAAIDLPGRASNGWDEFREGGGPGTGAERLGSVAGQSRYEFWSAAVDQNASKPLSGTGSGSFELWWARNATTEETVRDTHSFYLQTLGELGIVGFLLLLAFPLTIFAGGGFYALRASSRDGPQLVAALAGCAAFFLAAAVDWMWQIPVLPVAMLLLAAVLVTAGRSASEGGRGGLGVWWRAGFAALALAAIVAIAIPLAATTLLRESEVDARAGDFDGALQAARSAANVQPDSAAPRLQQALVLERLGDLVPAAAAAHAATEREPTNWRTWLVLSRIEAQRGRAAVAVREYRRAKALNPNFSLFRE